jgi:uncharacterized protein YqkB
MRINFLVILDDSGTIEVSDEAHDRSKETERGQSDHQTLTKGGAWMNIHVTQAALQELKAYEIPVGQGIRLDADMNGGCRSTVDLYLALDDPRKNDTVVETDGFTFYIDRFTQRYVDDNLTLDYDPAYGFKLSNPDEILSYGLTLYTSADKRQRSSSC